MSDIRSFGEIAVRTGMLTVAARAANAAGATGSTRSLAATVPTPPVRVIVPELTAGCPQPESPALMERCDILFPELRTLFWAR